MAGASDYVFNKAPTAADYPKVDFSWLGNLPGSYLQGAQERLALQGLALQNRVGSQVLSNMGGGAGGADTSSADPLAGGPGAGGALKNAIYGQESNYGQNPATSSAGAVGPMQILPSTWGIHALPGENINNPADNKRVGDRILDKYMQQYGGDWRRAAVAYYSGPGNVAPPGSPTPWITDKKPKGGPSVAGYVSQVGRKMAQNRTASTDPNFVPAMSGDGSMVGSSGGAAPGADRTRAPTNGETQPSGGLGGETSPPAAQGPTPSGEAPQPYRVAQAGSPMNAAAAAQLPAQWRGHEQEALQRIDAALVRAQEDLRRRGKVTMKFGGVEVGTPTADLEARIKQLQTQRDNIASALKEGNAPTDIQKTAASQGQTPAQYQETLERGKLGAEVYTKQLTGINAAATQATGDMLDSLKIARSAESDPNFYSGPGERFNQQYKKILGVIDPEHAGDANPQQVYKKAMAHLLLAQIGQFKAANEATGGSGRMYIAEINKMVEGTQNLENTREANRILTETGFRTVDRLQQIAKMANAYKGGNLDAGFNTMLNDWVASHPLFSPEELKDMRKIGAPVMAAKDAARLPKNTLFKGTDGKYYTR